MPWIINWDNGASACGTWDHVTFDSEEEARKWADSTTEDYILQGIWGEEGGAEPLWVEPNPSPEDIEGEVEQSYEYFNRYVAGDR